MGVKYNTIIVIYYYLNTITLDSQTLSIHLIHANLECDKISVYDINITWKFWSYYNIINIMWQHFSSVYVYIKVVNKITNKEKKKKNNI